MTGMPSFPFASASWLNVVAVGTIRANKNVGHVGRPGCSSGLLALRFDPPDRPFTLVIEGLTAGRDELQTRSYESQNIFEEIRIGVAFADLVTRII